MRFPWATSTVSVMTHPGSAIRAMRETQGLTLRDLAKLSGTSYAYLSKVERELATPTGRWLRDVTDALAEDVMNRGDEA